MPPPRGSIGADQGGQEMAFRRARSSGGNRSAEQARTALAEAFKSADIDRSGMIGPCRRRRASAPACPPPAAGSATARHARLRRRGRLRRLSIAFSSARFCAGACADAASGTPMPLTRHARSAVPLGDRRLSSPGPVETDKQELAKVIRDQLQVQLTDPINDLDIIFDSLDDDKSGLVSMDEVCACVHVEHVFPEQSDVIFVDFDSCKNDKTSSESQR
jgi:hypothetical protein